jgi:hypothetical protein
MNTNFKLNVQKKGWTFWGNSTLLLKYLLVRFFEILLPNSDHFVNFEMSLDIFSGGKMPKISRARYQTSIIEDLNCF